MLYNNKTDRKTFIQLAVEKTLKMYKVSFLKPLICFKYVRSFVIFYIVFKTTVYEKNLITNTVILDFSYIPVIKLYIMQVLSAIVKNYAKKLPKMFLFF